MERYAKIINNKTKEVQVGVGCPDSYYIEIGMSIMDVEEGYDGKWYKKGYAPEKPEPTEYEKKESVRTVRNNYLQGTDFTQLTDAPFTEEQKAEYREYRQYLRDYTLTADWWLQYPLTFEDWRS